MRPSSPPAATSQSMSDAQPSARNCFHANRSAGYAEVPAFNDEPYAHHWFEKQLTSP